MKTMRISQVPTYNLKAVLKETGIAADTLRAWERRYGLPMPERTPGGHRLYSQRDIYLVKWLIARQAEGLSISRAAQQWKDVTADGIDPLEEPDNAADSQGVPAASASLNALREQWLAHCLNFNEAGAEQVLNQAFAIHSVETVASDLIQRGLREIGEMWQRGEASVQQEHFISALAMRRFDSLISATPPPIHDEVIVLACPPGELHTLPLLYLNLMLRRRSWNAVFLGGDVPEEHLEETSRSVNAALVVMSAQRLASAAALKNVAGSLAEKRIPVAYGGRIFNRIPEIREQITGQFLGEEMEASLDQIEQLLAMPFRIKRLSRPTENNDSRLYRDARPQIDSIVHQHFAGNVLLSPHLAATNGYFGSTLAAALELGNVAFLAAEMQWLKVLLQGSHLPIESMQEYLTAYSNAMRQAMGPAADESADWLEAYTSDH